MQYNPWFKFKKFHFCFEIRDKLKQRLGMIYGYRGVGRVRLSVIEIEYVNNIITK